LPLHLRLADILIQEGRAEEAVHKYTTIAHTYQVRHAQQNAVAIYRRALDIAPMDIDVREQLIRTLLEARLFDQAIEQYIAVADVYYQLAQVNRAVEKYSDALRYAPQSDPTRHWEANILNRIGDIYMQRLNWQQAIRAYQRVRRIDPEDEKARSYLADLYFKTGQRDQALQALDELAEFYRAQQQPQKSLSALQEVARSHPDELGVRMRLAKSYLDMQMKTEAMAELDAVGELQLNAGMTQEAIRTVQAIIRLGPENVQGYQQLLAQLKNQ
jgi:tetratricopeptide (TPR) repeat protein